jgi:hypothetical protein
MGRPFGRPVEVGGVVVSTGSKLLVEMLMAVDFIRQFTNIVNRGQLHYEPAFRKEPTHKESQVYKNVLTILELPKKYRLLHLSTIAE